MKQIFAGLSLLAGSSFAALPALADCALFEALVRDAEVGKGFTSIVPFRAGWDLRDQDDTVPAQFLYPGFDTCWIEDNDWKNTNRRYGDPGYVCTLQPVAGEANTIPLQDFVLQSRAIGEVAMDLRKCVEADERFTVEKETTRSVRYRMKPELTEMRGLFENPRVWVEMSDIDNPPTIEGVPPNAPPGMVTPFRLVFTVFGPAQDFDD